MNNSDSKFSIMKSETVYKEYSIIFRLPKKYQASAEEYLLKSGEKNLNALAQKLLIEEIEKGVTESNSSAHHFNDEYVYFLLAALGNSRELFLRVFEILFSGAEANKLFRNVTEESQNEWLLINEMFERRITSKDDHSGIFSDEISVEIDDLFETKFTNSVRENSDVSLLTEPENILPKNLKQASLFD